MIGPTLGDLAHRSDLRSRNADLKQTIARLTDELTTGRSADLSRRLGGDLGYLGDMEQTLARLDGFTLAASEAAIIAEAGQLRLGQMQDEIGRLSSTLLSASVSTLPIVRDNAAAQARAALETMVSALNGQAGGRSLFAGTSTDVAPLVAAEDLLAGLRAAVAGAATVADADASATAWFSDPTGFAAIAYRGGTQDIAGVAIGPGEAVALSLRADDPVFRDLLRQVGLAALSDDPALALAPDARADLLGRTGRGLLLSQDSLTGLRADLGFAQSRIEDAQARSAAARTSLTGARANLVGADPFDTATRLEEARFQLESLYAVTARMSRLSLVNFLS